MPAAADDGKEEAAVQQANGSEKKEKVRWRQGRCMPWTCWGRQPWLGHAAAAVDRLLLTCRVRCPARPQKEKKKKRKAEAEAEVPAAGEANGSAEKKKKKKKGKEAPAAEAPAEAPAAEGEKKVRRGHAGWQHACMLLLAS